MLQVKVYIYINGISFLKKCSLYIGFYIVLFILSAYLSDPIWCADYLTE